MSSGTDWSASTLAQRIGCQCFGDGNAAITHVATLAGAGDGGLAFCASDAYREALATTAASAVILRDSDRVHCPATALVSDNPYLAYARAAGLLHPEPAAPAGTHETALISADACVDPGASIGPQVIVECGASIGAGARIEAGAFVGRGCQVAARAVLHPRAVLAAGCQVGTGSILHAGAVVGSDGFGFARDGERWEKVPQLGGVVVGEDVEIGANATVDRGALEDTVIEDGVKLDDHVHIAHNVRIGAHTVIAGHSGVAGSTTIGRCCQIGGNVAITGHIHIADNAVIYGMTGVTKSITEPGQYASPLPAQAVGDWRRNTVRFLQLDDQYRRLLALEKRVRALTPPDAD
jgi:UDP-3-O-[3-hydroxymyristoyl] glucosamine N-acyltransferase